MRLLTWITNAKGQLWLLLLEHLLYTGHQESGCIQDSRLCLTSGRGEEGRQVSFPEREAVCHLTLSSPIALLGHLTLEAPCKLLLVRLGYVMLP